MVDADTRNRGLSRNLFTLPMLSAAALGLAVLTAPVARAGGTDCVLYATDYANARMGSGDVVGDVVSGGMDGAVAGGAWAGPRGARRGARTGGAMAVMDNLGSLPGGWDALYDMAYQICQAQNSGASSGLDPNAAAGASDPNCRSTATVNSGVKRMPGGAIVAGSGLNGCR